MILILMSLSSYVYDNNNNYNLFLHKMLILTQDSRYATYYTNKKEGRRQFLRS